MNFNSVNGMIAVAVVFVMGTAANAQGRYNKDSVTGPLVKYVPNPSLFPTAPMIDQDEKDWMLTCQASYLANPGVFVDDYTSSFLLSRDDVAIQIHQTGVETELRAWGFKKVEMFHDRTFTTDTRGFIAYSDDTVVVSFSGSEVWDGFVDWWGTDANIALLPGEMFGDTGNIHMGFAIAADSVYLDILARVDTAVKTGKRVLITGHSLGGALATLTASRLTRDGVEIDALYAFANPAVGDAEFCDAFAASGVTCVRTYNHFDPIPLFPMSTAFALPITALRYHHVPSTEIYFDSDGNAIFNPSFEQLMAESYFITAINPYFHDPIRYVALTYINLSNETRDVVPVPTF